MILTKEHIIADGLGGDLILPDASCLECAKETGRVEQLILRQLLQQPRGALGVRSRKKRPKQTEIRVNTADDGEAPNYKEIALKGMPPFLISMIGDQLPGIIRGAPKDEEWRGRVQLSAPADFNQQLLETNGEGMIRYGFKFHPGVFGQLIAKTCHAFAVAHLGINGFEPFLTDYIREREPPFDSYHLASMSCPPPSEHLHEISLNRIHVPHPTSIGIGSREVYAVKWRMFGPLSAPIMTAVVGKPINGAPLSQ